MSVFWNATFNFWQLLVAFVINGVIPPAIITSFFYYRLEYMESEDDTPPKFKGVKELDIKFEATSYLILIEKTRFLNLEQTRAC